MQFSRNFLQNVCFSCEDFSEKESTIELSEKNVQGSSKKSSAEFKHGATHPFDRISMCDHMDEVDMNEECKVSEKFYALKYFYRKSGN